MLRAIREIQPRYVVGENVRGLTNWNGGLVFDQVQADLENEGFEVLPFLLPACATNAPHQRERIWFVANANKTGLYSILGERSETETRSGVSVGVEGFDNSRTTTDSCKIRLHPGTTIRELGRERFRGMAEHWKHWKDFPTEHPVCFGNDGLSQRLDGIGFSKWRKESIMALGNAIVPQVAYQIFKAIEQTNSLLTHK